MNTALADCGSSCVVVIDLQDAFMAPIAGAPEVVRRASFLIEAANMLKVPVIATEQVPERMGGTTSTVQALMSCSAVGKTSFDCGGSPEFLASLQETGRRQIVMVGIETHICVMQTALQLLSQDYEVFVCADAVAARGSDASRFGLRRLEAAGAIIAHTESIVYEWMGSSDHPAFRELLQLVKRYPFI